MSFNSRLSKDPNSFTINDLKLFEQTNYCFDYIKDLNQDKFDNEIMKHAEIASACFRQASEYYKAANSVSLSTSPLLFSYAFNNLLKGTCYLMSFKEDIINGFGKHGFVVDNKEIADNILKSKISLKKMRGN